MLFNKLFYDAPVADLTTSRLRKMLDSLRLTLQVRVRVVKWLNCVCVCVCVCVCAMCNVQCGVGGWVGGWWIGWCMMCNVFMCVCVYMFDVFMCVCVCV
jgi:hypothetical protein